MRQITSIAEVSEPRLPAKPVERTEAREAHEAFQVAKPRARARPRFAFITAPRERELQEGKHSRLDFSFRPSTPYLAFTVQREYTLFSL